MDLGQEKKLVKKARKEPEVLGALFDEYYPKIFGYTLRRVMNVEIAQEVTSEVFLKMIKRLWQFRWRNISLSAWLYRIATNEINSYFRKKVYRPASLEALREENAFDPISPQDLETELMEAQKSLQRYQDFLAVQQKMAKLPLHYQEVIALRFFEEKKITEICEILGKKEGTVKSLLSRGLEQLREYMCEYKKNIPARPVENPGIARGKKQN